MNEQTDGFCPNLFIIIVDRGKSDKLAEHMTKLGSGINVTLHGKGTADRKLLSYLGLGEAEKDVLFCAVPRHVSKAVSEKLDTELFLKKPGRGIAFSVPISSIQRTLFNTNAEHEKEKPMSGTEHQLIIIISSQGYAEEIMAEARKAGATGGTIIHARGTGAQEAEKFFGISIQAERELLLILSKSEQVKPIIEAVEKTHINQAGLHTIAMALPVSDVAGLAEFDKHE